jgi:murein L,D-transpeptidase YcbB/YkuD
LQIEDDVKLFGNKNISDTNRLFEIVKRSKEENLLPNDVTNLDSIELSNLVKRIQEKKNLEIDGKYGRQLILALNDTDSEKFLKIVINMDRLRRNREEYPNRYLWVNLPSFYLQVFENGETKIESKVIIGKPNTRTPLITSKINQITTYPTWTIPTSIISKEILPNIYNSITSITKKIFVVEDFQGNKFLVDDNNVQFGINDELIKTNNKDMVANKNKKTDEEKREAARIRKANQRLRLKDKYGNDEYNRQKAADLAKYRKNKKTEV